MNRRHAAVIALFLAVALVAGAFAALRTTNLGVRAQAVPAAQIAAKSRQLDRYETALVRQAKRKPPKLPALPALPPAPAAVSAPVRQAAPAPAAAPLAAAQAPRVVYVRPKPIVKVVPRQHEDEHEYESASASGHESDNGGGGEHDD